MKKIRVVDDERDFVKTPRRYDARHRRLRGEQIIRENRATSDVNMAILTVRFADVDKLRRLRCKRYAAKPLDKGDLLWGILLKTPPRHPGEDK